MKNLTDEQIKSELERIARECKKDRARLWAEYRELADERDRRVRQALETLSDEELAENLHQRDYSKSFWDDGVVKDLIKKEIARRERARRAALLRGTIVLPLAEMSTEQLIQMADSIAPGGPTKLPVGGLIKELKKRELSIQRALKYLKLVARHLQDAKTVRDPPLKLITGGGER